MTNAKLTGESISRFRKSKNLSIKTVARNTGLSTREIKEIEAEQKNVTEKIKWTLVSGLHAMPFEFMPRSNPALKRSAEDA